jgi:hypothetical protein
MFHAARVHGRDGDPSGHATSGAKKHLTGRECRPLEGNLA